MFLQFKHLISIILVISTLSYETGKDKGAYLKTPDSKNLQFRLGNWIGYYGNGWKESSLSELSKYAGYDSQRKRLIEFHFNNWGYDTELEDCKKNKEYGLSDVVGYLGYPIKSHSSNATGNSEFCYPANLYERIWLDDGSINPDNYWASYVYKTVNNYKDYIKIWQVWNEIDYTTNFENVEKWSTEPPNGTDLIHWYGTIYEYIRLLRITYEVAKKIDPDCWVSTGGIKYPQFLDAIMRYSDNPDEGKITDEYPAYGGAYFDCVGYHLYPEDELIDLETEKNYNSNGSDILAKKIAIMKKNHYNIAQKHEFNGQKYPAKIFINTETGLNSNESNGKIGGDLLRRNWVLKLALYSLEFDIKQIHMPYLADNNGGMGDFDYLGKFSSVEEGSKKLKNSSKGRNVLKKIELEKTEHFRKSLPESVTGIALKNTLDDSYIYSAWLYCENDEKVSQEIETELDTPFDPLVIDWEGNENNKKKNEKIKITSTPIFLLGKYEKSKDSSAEPEGTSGFVIFLEVMGIILLIAILVLVGLYLYKRHLKKKSLNIDDKNFNEGLIDN